MAIQHRRMTKKRWPREFYHLHQREYEDGPVAKPRTYKWNFLRDFDPCGYLCLYHTTQIAITYQW